ncbi:hypothetical protein [Alsobacter sp. R-9]
MTAAIRTEVFGSRDTATIALEATPNRRPGLLATAMMAAGMVAGVAAGGLAWLVARPAAVTSTTVAVSLGMVELAVPSPLLREGARQAARDGRVDLALRWPDLGPVDPSAAARAAPGRLGETVLVSIAATDPAAPQGRLATLYGRFLEPSVRPGPAGLMVRHFKAGSPYEGEEVLFSPPDGNAFTARCDGRPRPGEVLQPVCMAEFRRGALDVRVLFEPRLAEGWERMTDVLLPMVAGMAR